MNIMRCIHIFLISITLLCGHKTHAQTLAWETGIFSADSLTQGWQIKHDAMNNIYTVGIVYSGLSYLSKQDSMGNLQWDVLLLNPDSTGGLYIYALRRLVVDNNGNSYVCLNYGGRGVIEKFNSSGVNQWIYRDSGVGVAGIVLDIVLTPDGNVAFTAIDKVGGVSKTFVKSITQATSALNWTTQITLVDTSDVEAIAFNGYHSVDCDGAGNIYAGVLNVHTLANTEYIDFAKCSSSGTLRWQVQTPTAAWTWETMGGFKTDFYGNIYATGGTSNVSPSAWALKIDSAGTFKYFNHFSDGGRGVQFIDVQNDSLGNAYLSGTIRNVHGSAFCVAAKIDTSGSPVWIRKFYNDTTQQNIYAQGYVLNNKTFYTAGQCYDSSTHCLNSFLVSCYDSSGNLLWHRTKVYHDLAGAGGQCYAMDVDNSKNIVLAGFTMDTTYTTAIPSYMELYVVKYSTAYPTAIQSPAAPLDMQLYPVPAAQVVHVKMPAPINTQWEAYNIYGQKQATGHSNGDITINTALWPAGNYIFHCTDTGSGDVGSVLFTVVH